MKILFFANTDWYLYNFRFSLANAIRNVGHEVVFVSPPGVYAMRFQEAGFRWIPVSMQRRSLNPWTEIFLILKLANIYRKERPDIAHHCTIKCVVYGSIAAWLAKVRCVVNEVTGLGQVFVGSGFFIRLLRPVVVGLLKLSFKMSKGRVIFQNNDDRTLFLKKGLVAESDTFLIKGSGVNIEYFTPSPEPENSVPLVVLASRMLWAKGIGEFVDAARILRDAGVAARFVLVGESDPGNPGAIPTTQLEAWNKSGIVEWWGRRDDMPKVFANAHIVCLPSHREGLPMVLIEAAACGRPIVTTDTPGCRDVVRHGLNGLLAPVNNPKRLAEAIRTLIESPALRKQMGEMGRNIAVNEFSESRINAETLQVYNDLLKEQR